MSVLSDNLWVRGVDEMKGKYSKYKDREKRTYRCNNCEYVFSLSQRVGALPYGRCLLCFTENITEIGNDS